MSLKDYSNADVKLSLQRWTNQYTTWKSESCKITKIVDYVKETLSKFIILPKDQMHEMALKIDDLRDVARTSHEEIRHIRLMIQETLNEIESYIQSFNKIKDKPSIDEISNLNNQEIEQIIQKCLKQKAIFSDIYLDTGFNTSMLSNLQSRLECLKTNIAEIVRKSSCKKNTPRNNEQKQLDKSNTIFFDMSEEKKSINEKKKDDEKVEITKKFNHSETLNSKKLQKACNMAVPTKVSDSPTESNKVLVHTSQNDESNTNCDQTKYSEWSVDTKDVHELSKVDVNTKSLNTVSENRKSQVISKSNKNKEQLKIHSKSDELIRSNEIVAPNKEFVENDDSTNKVGMLFESKTVFQISKSKENIMSINKAFEEESRKVQRILKPFKAREHFKSQETLDDFDKCRLVVTQNSESNVNHSWTKRSETTERWKKLPEKFKIKEKPSNLTNKIVLRNMKKCPDIQKIMIKKGDFKILDKLNESKKRQSMTSTNPECNSNNDKSNCGNMTEETKTIFVKVKIKENKNEETKLFTKKNTPKRNESFNNKNLLNQISVLSDDSNVNQELTKLSETIDEIDTKFTKSIVKDNIVTPKKVLQEERISIKEFKNKNERKDMVSNQDVINESKKCKLITTSSDEANVNSAWTKCSEIAQKTKKIFKRLKIKEHSLTLNDDSEAESRNNTCIQNVNEKKDLMKSQDTLEELSKRQLLRTMNYESLAINKVSQENKTTNPGSSRDIRAWSSDSRIDESDLNNSKPPKVSENANKINQEKALPNETLNQKQNKSLAISPKILLENTRRNDENEYDDIKEAKTEKETAIKTNVKQTSNVYNKNGKKIKFIKKSRRIARRRKFSKVEFFLKHQRFKDKIQNMALRYEDENTELGTTPLSSQTLVARDSSSPGDRGEYSGNRNNESKRIIIELDVNRDIVVGEMVGERTITVKEMGKRRSSNNHAVEYVSLQIESTEQQYSEDVRLTCDSLDAGEYEDTKFDQFNETKISADQRENSPGKLETLDIEKSDLIDIIEKEHKVEAMIHEKEIEKLKNDHKTAKLDGSDSNVELNKDAITIQSENHKKNIEEKVKDECEKINKVIEVMEKQMNKTRNLNRINEQRQNPKDNHYRSQTSKSPYGRKDTLKAKNKPQNIIDHSDKILKNNTSQSAITGRQQWNIGFVKEENKKLFRDNVSRNDAILKVTKPRKTYNLKKSITTNKEHQQVFIGNVRDAQNNVNTKRNLKTKETVKNNTIKKQKTVLQNKEKIINVNEIGPENGGDIIKQQSDIKVIINTDDKGTENKPNVEGQMITNGESLNTFKAKDLKPVINGTGVRNVSRIVSSRKRSSSAKNEIGKRKDIKYDKKFVKSIIENKDVLGSNKDKNLLELTQTAGDNSLFSRTENPFCQENKLNSIQTDTYRVIKLKELIRKDINKKENIQKLSEAKTNFSGIKADSNSTVKLPENVLSRKENVPVVNETEEDNSPDIEKIVHNNGDARNDFKTKIALKNELEKKVNVTDEKEINLNPIFQKLNSIVNTKVFETGFGKRKMTLFKKDAKDLDCKNNVSFCKDFQTIDSKESHLRDIKDTIAHLNTEIKKTESFNNSFKNRFFRTKSVNVQKNHYGVDNPNIEIRQAFAEKLVNPQLEMGLKVSENTTDYLDDIIDYNPLKYAKIKQEHNNNYNFDGRNIAKLRIHNTPTKEKVVAEVNVRSIREGHPTNHMPINMLSIKSIDINNEDDTLIINHDDTYGSMDNNYMTLEQLDRVENMQIKDQGDFNFKIESFGELVLTDNLENICYQTKDNSLKNIQNKVNDAGDIDTSDKTISGNDVFFKYQNTNGSYRNCQIDQQQRLMEMFNTPKVDTVNIIERNHGLAKKIPLKEWKLEHDIWLKYLEKENKVLKFEEKYANQQNLDFLPTHTNKEFPLSDEEVVEIESLTSKDILQNGKRYDRLKRMEEDKRSFRTMCVNRVRRRKEIRIINQAIYTQKQKQENSEKFPKRAHLEPKLVKKSKNLMKGDDDTSDDIDDDIVEVSQKLINNYGIKEKTLNHFGIINCLSNIRSNIFKLINKNNSNKSFSKGSNASVSEISNYDSKFELKSSEERGSEINSKVKEGGSVRKNNDKKTSVKADPSKTKKLSTKVEPAKSGCCGGTDVNKNTVAAVKLKSSYDYLEADDKVVDDKESIVESDLGSLQNQGFSELSYDMNLESTDVAESTSKKVKGENVEIDDKIDEISSKDLKKNKIEKPKFDYYDDDKTIHNEKNDSSDNQSSVQKTKTEETAGDATLPDDVSDMDFPINKEDTNNPKFWPTYVHRINQENSSRSHIACILKAKVGGIGRQKNIECHEIPTDRTLPQIDLREDAVSIAFELRQSAEPFKFDFDTQWKLIIPHILPKSSQKELVILCLDKEGTSWIEMPTVEPLNDDYKEYKLRFVETNLESLPGIFIVQTKTKVEAGVVTKHGARIMSSIDSRVFLSVPADAIRITLNTTLKISTIDNTFWKELKTKADKTVLDQVICSSHLIDFNSKKKKLIKPANISCFLPLNPEIKKQMEAQSKVVVPIKKTYSEENEDDQSSDRSSKMGDTKIDLNPFQKSLMMTGITGANANENIQVVCNSAEDDKWFPIENVQLSVDKTKEQISMELPTMQSIKFLMVRANRNITVENLAKGIRMIENEFNVRNSVIILMKSNKNPSEFVLSICLRSRAERYTSQLNEDGFQIEHQNSPIGVELTERQIVTAKFTGNVANRRSERDILRFTYQSLYPVNYKFHVKEIDSYAQRAIDHYRGYLQIFVRKLVKRPIEPVDPKIKKGQIQYHWVEEDVLVGPILITLPKKKLVHFKSFRDTVFNRKLLDDFIIIFATIAEALKGSWKDLGLALSISESRMQSIRHHNNVNNVERMAVQMLIFWLKGLEIIDNKQDKLVKALNEINRKDLGVVIRKCMEDYDASFTESLD